MTLQALKHRFLKSSSLLQSLLLIVTIVSFTSCAADEDDPFYFDVEAQKVRDEATIRKYFRDNAVDTTVVERTESGLYLLEVKPGEGELIEPGDTVEVHYTGVFTNNFEFDSSYRRGRTLEFVVEDGQVIDGWIEGIQKMRVGGESILYVPSNLAYGPFGRENIPPSAVLVFDIEVISKR